MNTIYCFILHLKYIYIITASFLFLRDEFISDGNTIRSVLDYYINITQLAKRDQYYVALTGKIFYNY